MAVFPASMPQGSANKPVSPVRQLCHAGAVLVACALLLCASFTEAAQRVRVGYCPLEGFFAVDAQGQFSGYGYEYLEELAGEAGWELECVRVAQGEEDAQRRYRCIWPARAPWCERQGEQFSLIERRCPVDGTAGPRG